MEVEKQVFDGQMFAGPAETAGQEQPLSSGPACSHILSGEAVSGQACHLQAAACRPRPACLLPEFSSGVLGLHCFQLEVIHTPKRHLGGRVCSPTNGAAALPATQASETCWALVLSGVPSTALAHTFGTVFSRVCDLRAKKYFYRYVPKTSLSSPPWPEVVLPDPVEEARHHAEVVEKVNELIARGQYGRLFAVVHFASHQWKVTSEDLILIENKLDVACGERIRLEKVLLVGADDFTLLGRPLLGKDLVRVEATVIEKTESWPRVNMRFQKRKNYKRKRIIVNPQTVLRINTIEIAPGLC